MEERDSLGDYCKAMERVETDRKAPLGHPIYVRIDGARFSSFTRGMRRPYDERMSRAMVETTKAIMAAYHCEIGYTQSDEISLVLFNPEHETHHGGKFQKLVSRLASKATAMFTIAALAQGLDEFVRRQPPEFDARAHAVPDLAAAAKVLWWREIDATKNAVSMAASTVCSHRELQGKSQTERLEMAAARGIDFDAYPAFFRRGTFVRRVLEMRELSPDELGRIPSAHRPTGPVPRHRLVEMDMPPLRSIDDKVAALFMGSAIASEVWPTKDAA